MRGIEISVPAGDYETTLQEQFYDFENSKLAAQMKKKTFWEGRLPQTNGEQNPGPTEKGDEKSYS